MEKNCVESLCNKIDLNFQNAEEAIFHRLEKIQQDMETSFKITKEMLSDRLIKLKKSILELEKFMNESNESDSNSSLFLIQNKKFFRVNKILGNEWLSANAFSRQNREWIEPHIFYLHLRLPIFNNPNLCQKPGNKIKYVHSANLKKFYLSEEAKHMFPVEHQRLKQTIEDYEKRKRTTNS